MKKYLLASLLFLLCWGCEENFNDIYLGPRAGAGGAGGLSGTSGQGGAGAPGGAGAAGESGSAGETSGQGGGSGSDGGSSGTSGQGGASGQGGTGGSAGAAGAASGAGGQAGAAGSNATCKEGSTQCAGATVETCTAQAWKAAASPCRWGCTAGACEIPQILRSGRNTTYALLSGGSLWVWGDNSRGQLGQGLSGGSNSTPTALTSLSALKQVAAHSDHACVLTQNDQVFCWGDNDLGVLLSGPQIVSSPALVPGLSQAEEVAVGGRHACVRRSDGTVLCWGDGKRGQLGQGKRDSSLTPVQVSGITSAKQLALGRARSCALLDQGGIVCWGLRGTDENADASEDDLAPTSVLGTVDAKDLDFGNFFGCLRDPLVQCWGANERHQISSGTTFEATPKLIQGLTGVVSMALGASHGCAVLDNGLIKCWGANDSGQTGKAGTDTFPPDTVPTVFSAAQVAAGEGHTCALSAAGDGWCWGRNDKGQLGLGSLSATEAPKPISW